MNSTGLTKAAIINLDKGGPHITCMFNPKEYSFSKSNRWASEQTAGANMPQLEFGGGQPATLRMQLVFDTYSGVKTGMQPEVPAGADVRKQFTDRLWQLMIIDESLRDPKNHKGRPPKVRFQWGQAWSFDAVITQLEQKFTLFLSDGTPVRAVVDVTFQQIKDETLLPAQNPTSGGVGGERVWTVQQGETLSWIAYKAYGDSSRWRTIAEANGLTRLRVLPLGLNLLLPNP